MKKVFFIAFMAISLGAFAQTDTTEVKKDTAEGWKFTTIDESKAKRLNSARCLL